MPNNSSRCPVCASVGAKIQPGALFKRTTCAQCGEFDILVDAANQLAQEDAKTRAHLSAWIRQSGKRLVRTADVNAAAVLRRPSLLRRADAMLRFVSQRVRLGESFQYGTFSHVVPDGVGGASRPIANPLLAVGWNLDESEARYMLGDVLCEEMQLLSLRPQGDYCISPKGYVALESNSSTAANVAFCAMWFNEEIRYLFDEIMKPGIEAAGYEAFRIDQKEHNNKIDDEIIAAIRSSRFVVADYTGERCNTYYEAGFAHGLGLPVIFMVRDGTPLHFDTRQYNMIFWTPDDRATASARLKSRILATLGRGPFNLEAGD